MSLRYRVTGELLCAAKHPPMPNDTYIDDGLHYMLSVIQRVVIPESDEDVTGRWHWRAIGEPFRSLPGDAVDLNPILTFGLRP